MAKPVSVIARLAEVRAAPRAAEPDDIAGVIAFLASDDARFIAGANIPVDGGLSASNGQPRQAWAPRHVICAASRRDAALSDRRGIIDNAATTQRSLP
ncbi:Enoyl-(Acyl carrier protein) reductase [Paraburkholderia lycopersici]|uniref:Enoyl-(Acyl carrier protein) reductase n=1 Tax=Paraburkholderia lycopersici TaxID=416944 RepID=A0A1G7C2G3_9BURK|nr:Enoyl-(Acyl carrier protein) reductase [Paraburkholderia lycopersici]